MSDEAVDIPADGGQDVSVDSGSGQSDISTGSAEPSSSASVSSDPAAEPFFVYSRGDEPKEFRTKEELEDYVHNGTLRFSDYTKKTQSLAEQRKEYEANKARYDAEYTEFLQKKQHHDKIDKWLKSLPPNVAKKLEGELESNRALNDPAYRKMQEELEEIKKAEEERKTEMEKSEKARKERERIERANGHLSKRYPDYNPKTVEEAIRRMQETPPEEQLTALYEMMYHAQKGRGSKAPIPHQGGSPPGTLKGPPRKFKTIEEAHAAAMAENA